MHLGKSIIVTLTLLLCAGCASGPMRDIGLDRLAPGKGEQELSAGIRSYEDGNYKLASSQLRSALDAGLTFRSDEVRAYKYLAFIDCAAGREKSCREAFKKALALDPEFELSPAEAGHPLWGPVFRSVKGEVAGKTPRK
jgi:Tfp pilus assembly protein PilF